MVGKKREVPKAPLGRTAAEKVKKHPLIEPARRNYRLGNDVLYKRDMTRYVRWPKYVMLQRQRRVLAQRLKVPPALNQFNHTLSQNEASKLLAMLQKYKPETRPAKREKNLEEAEKRASGAETKDKKQIFLKYGLTHVADLVELKKAKLVVIAHDVSPVELVCWLPALCRKMDIPYCIIKGKSRLGQLVGQKTTCCVAIDTVRKEDQNELSRLCDSVRIQFNDNVEVRRRWGGGIMGIKSQHKMDKRAKARQAEVEAKMQL